MCYLKENEYSKQIKQILKKQEKEIVFLCVGSCNVNGDSVGPRVGSLLKQMQIKNVKVIGDMKKNVTAKNLVEISEKYNLKDKFMIVIDSAMGAKELVGKIFISNSKLKLGKALYKNILEIGNISIKACVCENLDSPIKNYYELKRVDIKFIERLVNEIINVIF